MTEINLLPVAIGAKTVALKMASRLKQIAVAAVTVFLVLTGAVLAYFLIVSQQLRTIKANQENLKGTLASLSTSEQQYVLVKDRVRKISQVRDTLDIEEGVGKFEKLQSLLPASIVVSEIEVKKDITEISLTAASSRDIVNFFESLLASETYKKIVLKSFSFNPSTGFLINLEVL
jgi:Tfp pilus assembly protein PilN